MTTAAPEAEGAEGDGALLAGAAAVALVANAASSKAANAIAMTERHRIDPERVMFDMICPSSPG
jgi:hypothetical protein